MVETTREWEFKKENELEDSMEHFDLEHRGIRTREN